MRTIRAPRGRWASISLLVLGATAALAPGAGAETVGADLEALKPTKAVVCPHGDACMVSQALEGNGSPFAPPTGVITSWSVRFGAKVPEGIRLLVERARGFGAVGASRKVLDVGALHHDLAPNSVQTFTEKLPIMADETFGVRLEASSRLGTRSTILAPFDGEYDTVELWDPPPPFGGGEVEPVERFQESRVTINAEVGPPGPGRCNPLNTYTGSSHGDDYGGFLYAGDVIYGYGGDDQLRGYRGGDCIYGGRGSDHIAGMDGNDLLVGGPGRDDIGAGEGNDRIMVRDGRRDTVRCGRGRDVVKADRLDRLSSCEVVHRG